MINLIKWLKPWVAFQVFDLAFQSHFFQSTKCNSDREFFWATHLPSGYLLHSHGKSPFLIGKPSINGASIPCRMIQPVLAMKESEVLGIPWLQQWSPGVLWRWCSERWFKHVGGLYGNSELTGIYIYSAEMFRTYEDLNSNGHQLDKLCINSCL